MAKDEELPILEARHPVTGKMVEIDYSRDVSIGSDVKADARRLSRKFSWYRAIRDAARDDLREALFEEHCAEEDVYVEIKAAVDAKTTETEVKTRVKAHPRMRSAFRNRMDAERRYKRAESVIEGLIEKRNALRMVVDLEVAEMSTGLSEA